MAFFVVNFGYTRKDFDDLTETERLFIKREYEEHLVTQSTVIRDAVLNAVGNALRGKGKAFRKLWRKVSEVDKKQAEDDLAFVRHMEEQNKDNNWIDIIRKNAGLGPVKKKQTKK